MDRSATFNNAGALAFANGHKSVALELFRGALESKLAFERAHPPTSTSPQVESRSRERCVTPESVLRAEGHLSRMDLYSTPNHNDEPYPVLEIAQEPAIPYDIQGFEPYLWQQPFQLSTTSSASSQVTSAIIVYNLGLIHQIASRTSAKAAAFYEISAALVASEDPTADSALLRVALMNNFGVWSFINGEGEALGTCMEHLSMVLREPHPMVDADVERNVQRNVQWFLAPPNGGSPAA
jgi:hypothetical protein